MIDEARFLAARETALARVRGEKGVGTLGEKTLHATLKAYFEPDPESREVALGGFVADAVGEDGIYEIQTRNLARLKPKLAAFLEAAPVTVVYPVPAVRYLRWIDPVTGEVGERRKTSGKGAPFDVFGELVYLKAFLKHPNFRLKLVLLELTDYRFLDGFGAQKKLRSTRGERIPDRLLGELDFRVPADYAALLPEGLPETFTVKDLAKCAKRPEKYASPAANVLAYLGVLERAGTRNRAYLYRVADHIYKI